jgi:hypothetical protein
VTFQSDFWVHHQGDNREAGQNIDAEEQINMTSQLCAHSLRFVHKTNKRLSLAYYGFNDALSTLFSFSNQKIITSGEFIKYSNEGGRRSIPTFV